MGTRKLTITLAAALVLLAATSWAIIPSPQGAPMTVTVQGKLTGVGGTPIAPGVYTFTFIIFDAAVGGTDVWPGGAAETHVIALQSDGLWTAYLGKDFPIHRDLVDDTARWLGVGVTPPVGPGETFGRVKLASAPFALEAAQLNGKTGLEYLAQVGDTVGGDLCFDRNGDGTFDAKIDLSVSNAADLTLYQSGIATSKLWGQGFGELYLADNSGDVTVDLSATTVNGGQLMLRKEDATSGMILAGGTTTNGATQTMRNAGGSPTIIFVADATDNGAATLPNNAISALEERDEPGVASNTGTSTVSLDGTVQTLLSRTITVPTAGYVLVIGTTQMWFAHTNGATSRAIFGVSDVGGSFPANQDVEVRLDAAAPSGTYVQAVTVHGLFSVSAGATTFYLLGQESEGSASISDRQLTLAYFPTAYGTVVSTLATGEQDGSETEVSSIPAASAQDIAAEQAEAERFNVARIERELATLRAEVQALTERLRTEESAQETREGDR